jgi:hypothetical protein
MVRQMPTPAQQKLAAALHQHGAMNDIIDGPGCFRGEAQAEL